MNMKHLKVLATATALSATSLVAVPAQAGPFGFLKKIVKQELNELAEETVQGAVDAAAGAVVDAASDNKSKKKGKVEARKVEEGEAAPAGNGGFRQEGGTTVPSADDVQAPPSETRVNVAAGDVTGDGRGGKPGMSQNGTTVPSADTVQAQQKERRGALILPAVQKAAPEPRPQAGTTQNGTTVPTADEVQAPQRPQRGKMALNGTTVETASEVQAPEQGD